MFFSDCGISEIGPHVRTLKKVKSKDSRNERSWGGWVRKHTMLRAGTATVIFLQRWGNRKNDVNDRLRFMRIHVVGVSSHWLNDMSSGSDPERFNHSQACNACVRNSAIRFELTA